MKVLLASLTIALLISTYSAATITLAATATVCLTGCTLGSSILVGGTPGAGDDVVLDAGVLAVLNPNPSIFVTIASGLTVRSISIVGAGSQLIVASGASLVTTVNTTVQPSAQLVVAGSATIAGVIQVADGTASTPSVINVNGTLVANGGINTAGANTQVNVAASASLTIGADSAIRGAINWAYNTSTVLIKSGVTSLYTAATVSAQVTVQTTLVVYSAIGSTAQSTYNQVAGTLTLASATASVNATVTISGSAQLFGTGTIGGGLTLSGSSQISIGNSPGTQYVRGDYNQGSGTTFNLEIESGTSFDRLVVTGSVNLNGNLKCIQYNGYVPSKTESYKFITAGGSVSGSYFSVYGSPFSALTKYSSGKDSTGVIAQYNSNSASAVVASFVVVAVACFVSIL